ncbi:aldo/keto reductase [Polyangium jinanense]|uniref:Aldo/keto reductase n=1 Tax=Polyangium jinanense TaxID=2829994 RepID=A0A9X3X0I2_9BACT|nr:aldo/keto reductase [Polyangium jinanense]MDC3955208.1 aldo/keto reductase [Polyangium jinanense]MDC3981509.1 aldo/keto reductase [Polyangium jinanense]
MPLDHYVTLGRSGLRVSPFCLGAMTFGEDLGWGSSVKDSEAILDRYIELGGNFIDTANLYTKGHSEKIIGDHLGHDPQKRDRLVIATKFSGNLYVGDPNGGGSNRKSILAACEQSLRRLRTDYIDLYWLHNWDKFTPIEETMAALHDLVRAGKVRYIGVSDTPAWKVAQAQLIAHFRGWAPFIGLQIEYSLVERTVEGELMPMAEELGLGVTPWSPLRSGVLSGKYTRKNGLKPEVRPWAANYLDEQSYVVIDELERIAKELDTTVARVALAWVQARPGVSSTIIGARTLSQLDDNLKALDVKLTPEQTAALDALTKPKLNFPADFLELARMIQAGGTTINGQPSQLIPFGVTKKGDHY